VGLLYLTGYLSWLGVGLAEAKNNFAWSGLKPVRGMIWCDERNNYFGVRRVQA
jgi:hypothetical protein